MKEYFQHLPRRCLSLKREQKNRLIISHSTALGCGNGRKFALSLLGQLFSAFLLLPAFHPTKSLKNMSYTGNIVRTVCKFTKLRS